MTPRLIACTAALLAATPVAAQTADVTPLPDPNDQSDTFSLAGGAAWIPDYEGSDDYRFIPAALIRGRVGGIRFFSRATYLYVDLVKARSGKVDFDLGPIGGVRMNRTGEVDDEQVDRLPELDTAIELGGFAGVTFHGLTNPYDSLGLRVDVVKDVAGAHEGTVITPTLDFGTPLSRKMYVGATLSADFASGNFADYYYSIDPDDAADSGLSPFDADSGMKNWRLGLLGIYALSDDLTKGWSLWATGSYGRLTGDFKRSPIVDDRGSAGQWLGAAGIAYTW